MISKFVIVSLLATLFFFIGFLSFITDHYENKCEMTYMYEYPQFVKISLDVENYYPKYGLYAYSEGKLTERARAMKFTGIPVLFIPGNAGSYKQVRSLASVALRKSLGSRVGYHFDFFTLDFNDELSGLSGAVLQEQTEFLNHSLYRILELYSSKSNAPETVITIGHSMGGVLAENLMVNNEYFRNINLLITLASPLKHSAVYLDNYISDYYKTAKDNSLLFSDFPNKTFLSVAGGYHDHLVNSWLTMSNFSSINVISTAVPTVWLSMDHACIVWCKQLVLTVIRALFDAVDLKTKQLSTDPNYRLAVFKHHFVRNSGVNVRWLDRYKVILRFDDRGEWKEDLRRQYSVALPKGTKQNLWYMIRIMDDPKHQAVFLQAINLEHTDWIFACNADLIRGQSRYCDSGIHLSHLSTIAPSIRYKRRTHFVDLKKLKKRYPKVSHVVARVSPTQEPVNLYVDIFNPNERTVNISLPRWFSLSRTTVIQQTAPEALRYEIHLLGLQHVIQMYLLYVEPIKCSTNNHHATATLSVPWAHHNTHTYITETLRKPLHLRLYSSRPSNKSLITAKVLLTLDPNCQYSVSVRNSFFGMLSQLARFYSPYLLANIAAVILMSFRSQLMSLDETGRCILFQSSISMSVKPYYLITAAKLISKFLAWSRLSHIIPMPDTQILVDENLDFLILPLLLYLIAVGITYLLSVGLWTALVLSESTVNSFVTKFITRTIGGAIKLSDWLLKALHRIPCVVATTLLTLGVSTCGGLSLCLGIAYYFLKLTHMCQDYLQGLALRFVKDVVFGITRKLYKQFKKTKKAETENKMEDTNETNKEQTNTETEQLIKNKETSEKEETLNVEEQVKNNSSDSKAEDIKLDNLKESLGNSKQVGEDHEIKEDTEDKGMDIYFDKAQSSNESEYENKLDRIEKIIQEQMKDKEQSNEPVTQAKSKSTNSSDIHFHFTIFLMWCVVALLNIPSVHTWAHNFQYSNVLKPDPSLEYAVILCTCAAPLWQFEFPRSNKKFYKELSAFVYGMALLCLIYAPVHLYRLSQILCATISITVIHQLFAPSKPEEVNDADTDEPDPIELLNEIKEKLE